MDVFKKTTIANIEFKNRILRSATHEGLGDSEGFVMPELAPLIERLAKGGVGGIIPGNLGISSSGRGHTNMVMANADKYIEGLSSVADAAHKHGTPIIPQINHGGAHCSKSETGHDVVSSWKCRSGLSLSTARRLHSDEVDPIIDDFVSAIVRVQKAGFDGVQLHAAHGYLLAQFLSPAINRRNDEWGGSSEKRFRIVGEIIKRAREKVGSFPILAKMSAYDGDRNGISPDEGLRIAELFQEAGCDALEISCGGFSDGFNAMRVPAVPTEALTEFLPAVKSMSSLTKTIAKPFVPLLLKKHTPLYLYNVDIAEKIKKAVDIPVIVVGGIRSLEEIENILSQEKAHLVSMSRPFIIEPNIVNKFKEGKQTKSRCIDCGFCLFGCMSEPLRCYYGKMRTKKED
ncbi:MAG: NADH:flavin oxidoreductase [bacterium]|nr:NADH:flavin oxidoreductase [bacterium]